MALNWFVRDGKQVILNMQSFTCSEAADLLQSGVFTTVVVQFCDLLLEQQSPLIKTFVSIKKQMSNSEFVVALLRKLAQKPLAEVVKDFPEAKAFLDKEQRMMLHEFVEGLYDFWRSHDRFMILRSEVGPSGIERRPYRAFNETVERLTDFVRAIYRDICENITGDHPRVYRQVAAGCNVALIAIPKEFKIPAKYRQLVEGIPFIRQVWIAPPFIIDPPMNKRDGQFLRIDKDIFEKMHLDSEKWLCYPAHVGPLVIFVYFHNRFIGLGSSLANLFELATDAQIQQGPDAVYICGAAPEALAQFGNVPTVFFDDEPNKLLVGAIPCEDRFMYFGYLKKMILTLHNIVMMKRGRMPFHGAMVRISLKSGSAANVLIIGDTATGKSESLEALRILGKDLVERLHIVADDMGSLEIGKDQGLYAYGTEIGAFIRLDDLQRGYAFQQIDRAILMSPQKVNARVVLPVTMLAEILKGHKLDLILYANNYEEVDDERPALQRFENAEQALTVFRDGAAMGKGTTTSVGLSHSYFANIFGAPQYKDLHEGLAKKVFELAFKQGVYVGQIRTRLGIAGREASGPQVAAQALLQFISQGKG